MVLPFVPLRIFGAYSLVATSILLLPCSAWAAPKTIGTFKAWVASTYVERGTRTCYIVSRPHDTEPKNVRRGETYIMVSLRPAAKIKDDVSLVIGYPYRKGSSARISIGTDTYELSTGDEFAWANDARMAARMVQAMMRGREMVVRGTSSRGTDTTDRYSLIGFTAAYQTIRKACP